MNLCIRLLSTNRGLTPLCLRPGCLMNEIISCTSAPRSSTKNIDWLDKRDIHHIPWNTNTCPILSLSQSDSLESIRPYWCETTSHTLLDLMHSITHRAMPNFEATLHTIFEHEVYEIVQTLSRGRFLDDGAYMCHLSDPDTSVSAEKRPTTSNTPRISTSQSHIPRSSSSASMPTRKTSNSRTGAKASHNFDRDTIDVYTWFDTHKRIGGR
jgi:hypothetical protein